MALSEHKETKKEDPKLELNPFYKVPKELSGSFTIEIDDFSRTLIEKGDSKALNLYADEVKASLGQRYVIVVFFKNNVAHLRAIPGFDFIEDVEKRAELAATAAKFFECKVEDVAFPSHGIWTGVVHDQLITRVRIKEPELAQDALIIPFSMIKKNDKYSWLNRSARNEDIFSPDALASACYVFEEKSDYTHYKPPKFDLYYHLKRSIPEIFFRKLAATATEEICKEDITPLAHSAIDECTNFMYEAKWEQMRKLYQKDKSKASEQIQHMLMRNLYVFLSELSAPEYKDRAQTILQAGLQAAAKYGIHIDLDFIPPEFEDHDNVIIKAEKSGNIVMSLFLSSYKHRYINQALSAALNENNLLEASRILEKLDKPEKAVQFKRIIDKAMETNKYDLINILYKAISNEQEKEMVAHEIYEYYRAAIMIGIFDAAKNYLKSPLSKILMPYIEKKSGTTSLMHMLSEILLEEKPDFNKKNAKGESLLNMAMYLPNGSMLVETLLKHNAVPVEGEKFLVLAAKAGMWDFCFNLLEKDFNPNETDHDGKTPLEYALEKKKFDLVRLLFIKGACLPAIYAQDTEYSKKLSDHIFEMINQAIINNPYTDILFFLKQTILNEKNPKIQSKLVSIIFKFYEKLITGVFAGLYADKTKILLELTDLPFHNVIDFNQEKSIAAFIKFLSVVKVPATKLQLINAVLDSKSAIGRLLLKPDSASQLFGSTQVEEFRKTLNDMKANIELEKKVEKKI